MSIQPPLLDSFTLQARPVISPKLSHLQRRWRRLFYLRLQRAYTQAAHLSFDNQTRIALLSDVHRGDGGRADAFLPNKPLFLHALQDYLAAGFTYVEVGDGDELWKNRSLEPIIRAHGEVFDLLRRFHELGRLHLITGNHDTRDPQRLRFMKGDLPTREGLVLTHRESGRPLFVVHGHQVDMTSSWLHAISLFVVETFLRRSQLWGVVSTEERPAIRRRPARPGLWEALRPSTQRVEERLMDWAADRQLTTICGHTHAPLFSSGRGTPYFNTGACVFTGYITALEIEGGQLRLVRWRKTAEGGIRREPLSGRLSLEAFS